MITRKFWWLSASSLALPVASCLLVVPLVQAWTSASPLPRCTIVGTPGNDTLAGTPSDDVICARGGNDVVRGGGGADIVFGGPGDDTLYGGPGKDHLYGYGGADRLFGGPGEDFLQGGAGPDVLSGGPGADIADYQARKAPIDVTIGRAANDGARNEGDDVRGEVEEVRGGAGDDTLVGDARANRLRGGDGRDLLRGGDGDDTLVGGAGNDRLDARDSARFADTSRCGGGRSDTARADALDRVASDCEVIKQKTPPPRARKHAPSDILLSNQSVPENQPAGTTVGTLRAVDRDRRDRHSFTLVAGGADNAAFTIAGSTLETNAVFDYEAKHSYSIRVQAKDGAGATFEKAFTITVNDLDDPPAAGAKSVTGVTEDGSSAIALSGADQDAGALTFHVSAPGHGHVDTNAPRATCDGATPSSCTAGVVYTPDADFNGADSFTYTVNDGTSDSTTATVAIAVDPVNDTPVATAASVSLNEDAPRAVDLGALASDLETSDANLGYQIVADPAHGHLDGGGATPTYQPDADYSGPDSFTYKVTDRGDPDDCAGGPPACDAPRSSSTQTVSITVDPVNDAPLASDAGVSVDEDASRAVDLAVLASDVETSDANFTYQITSGPSHGHVSGSAAGRTYTPDADYNGPDGFTYTVTDRGDPDDCGAPGPGCSAPRTSRGATVSIAVDAVDDAPVNLLPAGSIVAVRATDTPITGASISDVDAGGGDVRLTLSVAHGTVTVSTSTFGGVAPLQVTGNATPTVVVTASLAAIDATLAGANGLVYHSDAAYTGADAVTFTTDDLAHTGAGGPLTDTDTLALTVVPPNQPPVAAAQSATTNEDTAKTITLSASDADGDDPLSFAIATQPSNGSLGPVGAVTCDHGTPDTCTADVTYTPGLDYAGPDGFAFTAGDGRVDSGPATVSITVTAVDDAPELQSIEGAALTYAENDPATPVTASTTVSDVDSPDFDTGTLTVDYSAGGTIDDRLEIRDQGTGAGQIGVSGSGVTFGGATIGSFTGGSGTTPLVVTLDAAADAAATRALVRDITYRNVSDDPSTATRTARFVLTDGDGGTSAPATRVIAVTAVNDPPALAGIEPAALSYVESVDSPPSQSQITGALTIADPDSANLAGATVQIAGNCRPGEDLLVFSGQNGIGGSYTAGTCLLSLSGSSSVANYQAALRSVKYSDSSDTPSATTRTVTFQVDDGQSSNHAGNLQTRDVTVTASNDSPVPVADAFNGASSALAGVTLAVSTSPSGPDVPVTGNLLGNDVDPDTAHASLTATAGSSSAQGGVVAVNSDGTFSYTPPPGFTGADTFGYTVHDNDTPARTGTATVTIDVIGPRVWFVNPGASAGDGTSRAPLSSLAPLSSGGASDGLDGIGDVIFVYQGSGNATSAGFVLEGGQRLVGEPQGLSITDSLSRTSNLVAGGGANPTLTNGGGTGLTLADGNTIQRVNVTGASGAGVSGSSIGTLSYGANTAISGNGGGGLALSGAAGGAINIGADVTTSAGHSVSISNRGGGTTTLTGAISDTGTGISLSSNTGATINLSGGVTANTGASSAFVATGGGTVNVTGSANTLATTTGRALDVVGTTIGSSGLTFRSISANGAANGIKLDTTGSSGGLVVTGNGGTCTAANTSGCSGGQIQSSTGADDSSAAPVGTGIVLKDTTAPSLTRMWIHDNSNYAIRGTDVAGLTLAGSVIDGTNGTNGTTPFDDSSVWFDDLTGSASVTDTAVSGGYEDNFRVHNATGSLDRITFDNVNIGLNSTAGGNDGIGLRSSATAGTLKATIQNSTFTGAAGDLVDYEHNGTGAGDLVLTGNAFSNNHPAIATGGGGLTLSNDGAGGNTTMTITNNTFRDAVGPGILAVKTTGPSTQTGTFANNAIGVSGVGNSGSKEGSALKLQTVGQGTMTWAVTGNSIFGYNNNGVELLAGGGATAQPGTISATITGNTISQPGDTAGTITIPKNGIHLNVGTVPGDAYQACTLIGGPGALANSLATSGADGVPSVGGGQDVRLRQRQSTTIRLPGYAGAATDANAVQSFVAANNPFGGPSVIASVNSPPGGGFTGAGGSCP